jgi:hypothetical protein
MTAVWTASSCGAGGAANGRYPNVVAPNELVKRSALRAASGGLFLLHRTEVPAAAHLLPLGLGSSPAPTIRAGGAFIGSGLVPVRTPGFARSAGAEPRHIRQTAARSGSPRAQSLPTRTNRAGEIIGNDFEFISAGKERPQAVSTCGLSFTSRENSSGRLNVFYTRAP